MAHFEEEELMNKGFDRAIARRLFSYLKPQRRRVAIAATMMLVASGVSLISPLFTRFAVDNYVMKGDLRGLDIIAVAWLQVLGINWLASYFRTYLMTLVGQKVVRAMRGDLFAHLMRLSYDYYDSVPVGKTMTRLTSDVDAVNELLSSGIISVISETVMLFGIIILMISLDWRLALLCFSVLPLLIYLMTGFRYRIADAERNVRKKVSEMNTYLQENISGVRVVQAFCREKLNLARFDKVSTDVYKAAMRTIYLFSYFWPCVDMTFVLGTFIVLWYGGLQVSHGLLSFGTLMAFVTYVGQFFGPIRNLSQVYRMLQRAMAGGERIFRLIDTPVSISEKQDAIELPRVEGEVRLTDVYFAYQGDDYVLKGINLKVQPGETIALVGQTGAGKTSIINLIPRFYDINSGSITIDGYDVRDVTLSSLRSQVAIVLQEPFLFTGTIRDNLKYGRPEATDEQIVEVCRTLGIHDLITRFPQGYDTEVEERGLKLSSGQRQLVSFARALLADPAILILDEATASIDTHTERLIQKALKRLLQGRTSFVIAHRLSTIREASRIVVIDDGRIIEEGTHEELLASGGHYSHLYELQFGGSDAERVS